MAITTPHPDHQRSLASWLRARDVLAGEDVIKAAAERYLPRLDSQTDAEYTAYLLRASFFGVTARIWVASVPSPNAV
jgi:hypothetical protein